MGRQPRPTASSVLSLSRVVVLPSCTTRRDPPDERTPVPGPGRSAVVAKGRATSAPGPSPPECRARAAGRTQEIAPPPPRLGAGSSDPTREPSGESNSCAFVAAEYDDVRQAPRHTPPCVPLLSPSLPC